MGLFLFREVASYSLSFELLPQVIHQNWILRAMMRGRDSSRPFNTLY